jgi:hypothetical protein
VTIESFANYPEWRWPAAKAVMNMAGEPGASDPPPPALLRAPDTANLPVYACPQATVGCGS